VTNRYTQAESHPSGFSSGKMEPSSSGEWVRHTDYYELQEEHIKLQSKAGLVRVCVNCGSCASAGHDRSLPMEDCPSPEACTFDLTPSEAVMYWRKMFYDIRKERDALQKELAAIRAELEPPDDWSTHLAARVMCKAAKRYDAIIERVNEVENRTLCSLDHKNDE
jgi:hypothetical protein